MQPLFRATLQVSVWMDQDKSENPTLTQVEVFLDDPFTYQQLSAAGTAIQAGAWEALKKAVEQAAATTPTTPTVPTAKEMVSEFHNDNS